MAYRVETAIPIVFEDGKAVIPMQGQMIDLMKLDTIQELQLVLCTLAQQTLQDMVKTAESPQPQIQPQIQPVAQPTGPDFAASAEKIREQFHKQAQDSAERLTELAKTYEDTITSVSAKPNG